MLISLRVTVILVVSLSCLASAFSTLFVTEEAVVGRKTEGAEIKTPKTEENSVAENQVIVETIPFFTDVLNKVEDLKNLTPLKVATIISAQHLINTVKTIPVPGNLPQDTLSMLGNIVDEFNKTTQIIKLTAEYVNISSQYMLSSLTQLEKYNCDEKYVKDTMKDINKNFLDVISNHIKNSVREIMKKSESREMTGTDVLVSAAFHIVAAFQEMTNQVMSLKIDNTKCDIPKTPQNSEQIDLMGKNEKYDAFENFKSDAIHKSIKKDQAFPNNNVRIPHQEKIQDTLTVENLDKYPDLTVEIYPQESIFLNKKDNSPLATEKVKIPESLQVAFLPETKTTKADSGSLTKQDNTFKSQVGFDIPQKFGEISLTENVGPNGDLTLDIFSLQNKDKFGTLTPQKERNEKPEGFNVYYFPLKPFDQNQKYLPSANHNLKVPEEVHYYPESLIPKVPPLKTLSLFGNYDPKYYNGGNVQKKELGASSLKEGQKTLENLDDTFTSEKLRQDLTEEVFSPEVFMHKGKVESSEEAKQVIKDLFGIKETKSSQKVGLKLNNLKNFHQNINHNYKNPQIKSLDRELESAFGSFRSPAKGYKTVGKKFKVRKTKMNAKSSLSTILMPWDKRSSQYQRKTHKIQQKNVCDERVEPVCGVDKNKNNFIIFPNDCQRKQHNTMYKTSYEQATMDTCIGFLLKYSADKPTKYMEIPH